MMNWEPANSSQYLLVVLLILLITAVVMGAVVVFGKLLGKWFDKLEEDETDYEHGGW